ncbi:flagellar biosynthesis anti-sigma factor FlgM [Bacillus lacus]|uniref:Negative regulator of flagellin synthesis n=1 Tax=Metabacillus lacus TaxID=1983721 RepID=A0A7X2LZX5_9BACI|nr:flagellar biosynthesis anti-sigma factor FlgM [Metabacillus lacus]
MKINQYGTQGINPYKRNYEKQSLPEQGPVTKKSDKIEISSAAKGLQQSNEIVRSRQEKISSIKHAIETGNYEISSKEIAKSVLDFYSKQ